MDDDTAYASKMYLISEEDWELLSKEKHKAEQQEQLEVHEPSVSQYQPQPQPQVQPQTQPQLQTQPPPTQGPNDVAGEGRKKYSDIDIKKFNQDFLTKQNIERFIENERWNKVLDRIRPLFHENNLKKNQTAGSPMERKIESGDDNLLFEDKLTPSSISRQEEMLKRNTLPGPLIPHLTSSAQKHKKLREDERRKEEQDHIRKLFSSPNKRRRSFDSNIALKNLAASPYGPSHSTRHKKGEREKRRLRVEEEREQDNDDGPSSSGTGQFKKFRRRWEKF